MPHQQSPLDPLLGAMAPAVAGAETGVIDMEPVMHIQLASLAQASILQLRDAIRRATGTHLPADGRDAERFLDSVIVKESAWGEWADTAFDVRPAPVGCGHA